jgi:hypothetical protein
MDHLLHATLDMDLVVVIAIMSPGRNLLLTKKQGCRPGWKIPEFPKGLATAFGPKLFKILEDW